MGKQRNLVSAVLLHVPSGALAFGIALRRFLSPGPSGAVVLIAHRFSLSKALAIQGKCSPCCTDLDLWDAS